MKLLLLALLLASCSSKPKPDICPEANATVTLNKAEAESISGKVSQFLTDAKITQEHRNAGAGSLWRFTNMPDQSVYYLIGLRNGDAIYKTNLGEHSSSINLISDLSGIPSGTTNCLYLTRKDQSNFVIKILLTSK